MYSDREKRIIGYLGLANRQRKVVSGRAEVTRHLKKGKLRLLLITCDIPGKLEKEVRSIAAEKHVPVIKELKRGKLGAILGKRDRVIAGVLDSGLAEIMIDLFKDTNG